METTILDMQKYFEERMAKFELDLQKKSSSSTGSLAEEFATFKSFVLQTLKSFSQQLEAVARKVDNIEMHSRRNMVLLHGVEEKKDEETDAVVAEVVKQHLKLDSFTAADIKRCHRMGRQTSNKKPRPILIKLRSSSIRDSVWFSKTKLKGSGITLSEFLTRSRHTAFMAAREKFGVTKAWTRQGFVYVLGTDGQRHRISSLGDLDRVKCSELEKATVKATASKTRRAAVSKK